MNGYAFVRYSPVYYNGHYANRVDLNGYLQYDERPGGGSLLLQEESGYGFVDEAGNIIYDFVLDANIGKRYEGNAQDAHAVYYFKVSYFTEEGIAVVKQDGKYGVIDTNGNLICDFVYNSVETIGKFIVCTVDGEDILLDKYGNVLFDRGEYDEFKRISNTSEYIMLQKNGKWGVCHIDGEIVVRCEYDTIVPNTNGNSLCVQKDGKYGALSLHAEQLVPLEFEDMPWHSTDTAIVQKEGLYYIYFIPQQKLSDFSFDQIKALPDDDNSSFWAVKSSDKWGVINSNGDWILEPKYVNIMGDAAIIRAIIEASSTSHCEEYYDSNFNLIYYTKDGKTYDSQDREIYSYELAFWDTELIYPPAIYRCGRPTDGMGLMAIFEVPKPQEEVEGNYICMMLDNPLINVCGNVYPMEENNYFFKPVIENDRTLVPMRAIFEALGAEVSWYPEDETIVAVRGDTTVYMQMDDWYMSVNDEWIALDAPPRIVNDRTLIPLRAGVEAFGAQVGWDEATQTVTVELD